MVLYLHKTNKYITDDKKTTQKCFTGSLKILMTRYSNSRRFQIKVGMSKQMQIAARSNAGNELRYITLSFLKVL